MTDYSFTNRPDLGAGIYGHHLLTQWNIGQSDMLKSMQATGALKFRDFNFNGIPLSGSIWFGTLLRRPAFSPQRQLLSSWRQLR
jgi:hypothetical protein